MSTDDPNPFDLNLSSIFTKMLNRIPSDAYWIVKIAFHPELAKIISARR
jgi:hypothetical protein